jgi:hypothetical protein
MIQRVRAFVAAGCLGTMPLMFSPLGCGSGLGRVTAQELGPGGPFSVPGTTVDHLKGCVAEYGEQLEPGRYAFNPIVELEQSGIKRRIQTPNMPHSAPDLAACTRIALQGMAIHPSIFNRRSTESVATTNEPSMAQRSYIGSPVLVVVVVVGLSEIVLEAGAYTILFAVTVKVLDKAKDDVAEVLKRTPITDGDDNKNDCAERYAVCMATHVSRKDGNHWQQTRCGNCLLLCTSKNSWPSAVGNGSCEYWTPRWGR